MLYSAGRKNRRSPGGAPGVVGQVEKTLFQPRRLNADPIVDLAAAAVLCSLVGIPTESSSMKEKSEVWQGTLAIMVLTTLDVMGPQHGYGIARRIDQISDNLLSVNHGTLYPVLLKLEQEGSIASEWGVSNNNRKAKFYRLTKAGKKALHSEKRQWELTTEIVARFFALDEEAK